MAWELKGDGDDRLIMNGALLVGSVRLQGGTMRGWRVEVLWSGPGGDITYDAPSITAAQAFVCGVERTLDALGLKGDPDLHRATKSH